ncbi:MAG: hypothetical protein ACRBB3_08815 [Alphaproteobacteria bacterium]
MSIDTSMDNKKQKRRIITLYTFLFTSMTISFIPVNITSLFAAMVCVCTLSVIYSIRSTAEEDGLMENHTTYLIRTFWRANLFVLISSLLSLLYLTAFVNYVTLQPCLSYISENITYIIRHGSLKTILMIMDPCNDVFYNKNQHHLIIAAFIAFLPSLLYLLMRWVQGSVLIIKNERIPANKL